MGAASHPSLSWIKRLGVVGAGQMGQGIGIVTAVQAQLPVTLVDASPEALKRANDFIAAHLRKDVSKGKLSQADADAALARFSSSTDLGALSEADFVVEAASENVDLKKKIFTSLAQVTKPHAILATNTSSISITKIAAATNSAAGIRADKVVGMHFMNPVPVMKLVEVIPGLQTSAGTLEATLLLSEAMGKTCSASKDVPGFIANRLLMPYLNEAIYTLQDGVASREDIDTCMKLGTNMPMGPLTLADFIGLDTCLAIMNVLHQGLGDSKYRPAPLLQTYVDAGWLGKKSGRGFYEYPSKK